MLSRNKHQKTPQPPLPELPLVVGERNVLVDAVRIATNLPLCSPIRHPSFAIFLFFFSFMSTFAYFCTKIIEGDTRQLWTAQLAAPPSCSLCWQCLQAPSAPSAPSDCLQTRGHPRGARGAHGQTLQHLWVLPAPEQPRATQTTTS